MSSSKHIDYTSSKTVTDAIQTRRSLRAFLPKEVTNKQIYDLLDTAKRAPSGTNIQPWKIYVAQGDTRQALCDKVSYAFDNEQGQHESQAPYYPEKWIEPFISRRRKVGWDLYGLLGITKGDREKMHHQHRRNFQFFDAPVGLIFTIHKDLATGSWLDYGMLLQNIMLLAREEGLHTCPQAAWSDFHKPIREILPITNEEVVVCGMALGYADTDAIENTLVTERAELDSFVQFFE